MDKSINYPQYRKYPNGKSYFKVIAEDEFEEIQILGNRKTLHLFKAKILPDRNYIADLTFDYHNHWEVIEAEEYEVLREKSSQ
jgi:hypothetical protein